MKLNDIHSLVLLIAGAITGAIAAVLFFPMDISIPQGWGDIIGSTLGICGAYLIARATFRMEQRARAIEANTPVYNQIEFTQQEIAAVLEQLKIITKQTDEIGGEIEKLEIKFSSKRFYPDHFDYTPCLLAEIHIIEALQFIKKNQEIMEEKLEPSEIRYINKTKSLLKKNSDLSEQFEQILSDTKYQTESHEIDIQKLHNRLVKTTTNRLIYDFETSRSNLLKIKHRLEVFR